MESQHVRKRNNQDMIISEVKSSRDASETRVDATPEVQVEDPKEIVKIYSTVSVLFEITTPDEDPSKQTNEENRRLEVPVRKRKKGRNSKTFNEDSDIPERLIKKRKLKEIEKAILLLITGLQKKSIEEL